MFQSSHLIGFGASEAAAAGPVATFITNPASTTGSTPTFTSQSIGTASADRYVLVGQYSRTASTSDASGITITPSGGSLINMTKLTGAGISGGGSIDFYIALVTTATTADIVISLPGSSVETNIGIWTLTGLTNAGAATSTATPITTSGGTMTLSSVPAGGVAFALFGSNGSLGTTAWTGVTKDFDYAASRPTSGAHLQYSASQTNLNITCTASFSSGQAIAFSIV